MDKISALEWCLDVTKYLRFRFKSAFIDHKIHNKQIRKREVWKASWYENPVFFRNNESSSQTCQG